MSQLFYAPELPDSLILPEEEAFHLTKVLRHTEGDTLDATNGKGQFFTLEILEARKSKVVVQIQDQREDSASSTGIHLAVAPTKNIDRFEWMVEKCVELGAERITPILCDHSERKRVRIDRLEKIGISAMKQSLHSRKTIIDPLTPFKEFLTTNKEKRVLLAHCEDQEKNSFTAEIYSADSIICIGPEGDFSSEEIELAQSIGTTMIDLGDHRLRTETAGVHACSLAAYFVGRRL